MTPPVAMNVEHEIASLRALVQHGQEMQVRLHHENRADMHRLEGKIDGAIERGYRHDERINTLERNIEAVWQFIRGKSERVKAEAKGMVEDIDKVVMTLGWAWKLGLLIIGVASMTTTIVLWLVAQKG